MLHKIAVLIILFAFPLASLAQVYDNSVPAFLRQEAAKDKYGGAAPMQQNSVPAFLQQEAARDQYQYQSADPASQYYTLPPASYQPAPGDVPAFMQQGNQPVAAQNPSVLKTNEKNDVIQINFTDSEYKGGEEMQQVSDEDMTKYKMENPDIQTTPAEEMKAAEPKNEIQKASEAKPKEIEKSQNNILRISFDKDETGIEDKYQQALIEKLPQFNDSKVTYVIRSYVSSADNKYAIQRVAELRHILKNHGVDFSRFYIQILSAANNKYDSDYIDIDKI